MKNMKFDLNNILIMFFGFTLLLISLVSVINLIQIIDRGSYSPTTEMPIHITSFLRETYQLDSSKGGFKAQAHIDLNQPSLSFSSNDWNYKIFTGFHTLLYLMLVVIMNIIMLRLTISAKNNKPFQRKNIYLLYWLAGCTFIFWPMEHLKLFYYASFVKDNFNYSDVLGLEKINAVTYQLPSNVGFEYNITFAPIIGALILISVAQIFKNGVDLKEDNESIL